MQLILVMKLFTIMRLVEKALRGIYNLSFTFMTG